MLYSIIKKAEYGSLQVGFRELLKLILEKINSIFLITHKTKQIITGSLQRSYLQNFVGQEGYFSFVEVSFYLRRRTLYFTFNIIMPSLIITMLSIAGFILHPNSCEKIVLREY